VIITHEPSIAAFAQRTIHIKDGKIEKETKNGKV
jgi:ABC-type lipoprotein export system ATPase subunit